jgi:transglutaminase-like putative cysteine protease
MTSKPPSITPPEEEVGSRYGEAFGIDYDQPVHYLRQGEQTQIPDLRLLPDLSPGQKEMESLRAIYHWMKGEFTAYRAGGKTIGVVTVNELFTERKLGGCHDHALLFSAVVRAFGYPAVVMETYSISWMKDYREGRSQGFVGHVFVEVYLEDHWVLVDPTNGWYVAEGYDPANPFIPLTGEVSGPSPEEDGFFVDLKGVDSWDMGIYSVSDLNQRMESTADQFSPEAVELPAYTFEHF